MCTTQLVTQLFQDLKMQNTIQLVIQSLYEYPVKSCAGVRVDRLSFDGNGWIAGDREWAIVDAKSELVWQGSHPRLALVLPEFDNGALWLSNAGGERAEVVQGSSGALCEIKIWNPATGQHDVFSAHDGGDAAARLLSSVVGSSLRIVHLGVDAQQRQEVKQLHVLSMSSIAELNEALLRHAHYTASVERFRPNIVITGHHEPLLAFIEEQFTQIRWTRGDQSTSLHAFEPCVRCIVPNIDPATGVPTDGTLETLALLSAQRHPGKPVYFGVYARPNGAGVLVSGTVVEAALTF
jgi:uncharacterized protein